MTGPNEKLRPLLISPAASVRDALAAIDRGSRQIALVVDENDRLLGTVTDGDIRRALLRGASLDTTVTEVVNKDFTAAQDSKGLGSARELMRQRKLNQIPLLDHAGRVVDLVHVDGRSGPDRRDTRVILMAGGLGTRLRPLTETIPKPMLEIGGRPILERIIQRLTESGFHDFTIALNYRGEMIRDHFGDGTAFDARIDYVEEAKRMGTAGALSLLTTRPAAPFIVMNGDLLTDMSFGALMAFHEESGAAATMCARDFPMQVPYGVLEVEGTMLQRIVEKPTYSYFVNAGIYVLAPETLDHVYPGDFLDMPTLFERVIAAGGQAAVFPIREAWTDIGRHEDLQQARSEFGEGNG